MPKVIFTFVTRSSTVAVDAGITSILSIKNVRNAAATSITAAIIRSATSTELKSFDAFSLSPRW